MLLNLTCRLPEEPVLLGQVDDSYMANIWFSSQVGNCLLLSAHYNQMLHFTLTKDLYSKLSTFFQTSCKWYKVCVGKLLPTLEERYPRRHIELEFYTAERPILSIDDMATVNSTFYIDMKIQPEKGKPDVRDVLARLEMESILSVIPALYNNRICGEVNGTKLKFVEDFSRVGNISDTFLQTLELFLTPMFKVSADSLLRIGLPIPMVENMTLKNNSRIELSKNTIGIYADLNFLEQ
uniref:BPI2 domain-containing protein n=2 Tax=Bursaphelenchus xylophilus TaxID=6326 RepID=A0A1I7STP7_BURXY